MKEDAANLAQPAQPFFKDKGGDSPIGVPAIPSNELKPGVHDIFNENKDNLDISKMNPEAQLESMRKYFFETHGTYEVRPKRGQKPAVSVKDIQSPVTLRTAIYNYHEREGITKPSIIIGRRGGARMKAPNEQQLLQPFVPKLPSPGGKKSP